MAEKKTFKPLLIRLKCAASIHLSFSVFGFIDEEERRHFAFNLYEQKKKVYRHELHKRIYF